MDFVKILLWVACAVQAYLLGSVSFAYVIGKIVMRRDIRKYGSGNAGASNMTRNFGWKLGLLTFVCDIAKGAIAVLIGGLIGGTQGAYSANLGAYIAAVFAVAGHNWPVFFGFRGGKGAATTLGVLFTLMPLQGLGILILSGILIAITMRVSVGSLSGAVLMVVSSFVFFPNDLAFQICSIFLCALVIFSHRENIKRILNGTESKMTFGKGKPERIKKDKSKKVKHAVGMQRQE